METSAVYEEEEQYRYSYSSACESTRVAHIQRKNYSIKEKGFKRISFELLERTAVLDVRKKALPDKGSFNRERLVTKLEQRVQDGVSTERQAITGMVAGYHQRNGK